MSIFLGRRASMSLGFFLDLTAFHQNLQLTLDNMITTVVHTVPTQKPIKITLGPLTNCNVHISSFTNAP